MKRYTFDRNVLQNMTDRLNRQFFGNRIPRPYVYPLHSYTAGAVCTVDPTPSGIHVFIGVTDTYRLTYTHMEQLLLHELIHAHLFVTGQDTKMKHGKAFRSMCKHINRQTGYNLGKYADMNGTTRISHSPLSYIRQMTENITGLNHYAMKDMPEPYNTKLKP